MEDGMGLHRRPRGRRTRESPGKDVGEVGQRSRHGHQTKVLKVEESSERTGGAGALLRGRRVSSRFCHT